MNRNKDSNSYIKFLSVINAIKENSDEKHPLTINDIKEIVYSKNYDFTLDYRLIQKYVQEYNNYHEDDCIIHEKHGRNVYYYYNHTSLDIMEAKAIVDLVYSSDFFTMKTKENYKARIQELFSKNYHSYFNKKLTQHIVKNENDNVFYKELEIISEAIYKNKKIKFLYKKPNIDHQKIKEFTLTPVDTCFSNNVYYLLCQGNKDENELIPFRLDYISQVQIINNSHTSLSNYQIQCFNDKLKNISYMYGEGQNEFIELEFHQSVYSNIIDKFGKDIKPKHVKDDIYTITVHHIINSTFYSWIIGFGGKIKITGNQKEKFNQFLKTNFLD